MIIMYGRLEYDIHPDQPHDKASSEGPDDIGELQPPKDAAGCLFSVETAPVRLSFDGGDPTPSHGIVLETGSHFVPFARPMRFVPNEGGRATVSVVWVRVKLGGQPATD